MTLETLVASVRRELARSSNPIDVDAFLAACVPCDIEAGQLPIQAFNTKQLRGRLRTNFVDFDGHITVQGTG